MSDSPLIALQETVQSASRRTVLQGVAGVMVAGKTLASIGEDSVARKKQKKKRRNKSRRKQKPTPTVRPDALCSGEDTNGFPLEPQGVLAQSFTAVQSGSLVKATLRLRHFENTSATGNLFLRLAPLVDAFPEANALATAQAPASSVAFGTNEITFTFADPAPVKAGKSYALVLSRDGVGTISWATCDGATCDGRSFFTAVSSDPLQPQNGFDFLFTTSVQI